MAFFSGSSRSLSNIACTLCRTVPPAPSHSASAASRAAIASTSRLATGAAPATAFFSTSSVSNRDVHQPSERDIRAANSVMTGGGSGNATSPFRTAPGTARGESGGVGQALIDIVVDTAQGGIVPSSPVGMAQARSALRAQQRDQKKLYNGQTMRPGDFHPDRMFPAFKPRKAVSSLGPPKKQALQTDFYIKQGNLDPLGEPMNHRLHSRFVTNIGKIMNRGQTQLTWRNQRRMGKAVRRARAMGIMPYFSDWSDNGEVYLDKMQRLGMVKTTGQGM